MEDSQYVMWNGDGNVFAYRYPKNTFSKNSKIRIGSDQEVVVLVNEKISKVLTPGIHDLKLYNINFRHVITGLLGRERDEEKVEVWFVNKVSRISIFWKLNSYTLFDCKTNSHVPVYAEGRSILSLYSSEKFIESMYIGSVNDVASVGDFTQLTGSSITSTIVKTINDYMLEHKTPVSQLSEKWNDVSALIKNSVFKAWSEYGMRMTGFEINKMRVGDDAEKLRGPASVESSGGGFRSYRNETKSIAEDGIINAMKRSSGLMESLMAASRYGKSHVALNSPGDETLYHSEGDVIDVYCHDCGTRYTSDMSYCPQCGKKYHPCQYCGADNDDKSVICVSCGHHITKEVRTCFRCGASVDDNVKFCPYCGFPMNEKPSDDEIEIS